MNSLTSPDRGKKQARKLAKLINPEANGSAPPVCVGKQQYLDIREIQPSTTNPRKRFDEAELQELAETIRAHGILQPLLVRPHRKVIERGPLKGAHECYELVAGERRFRAAQIAGLERVPVLIRDMTDQEVLEAQVIENEQRSDLSALEKAAGYKLLIDKHKIKVEDLAARVGKSPATIYGLLKLLALPKEGVKAVEAGELPAATAQLVARLPGSKTRSEVLDEVLAGDRNCTATGVTPLSYRQTLALIQENYMVELKGAPFTLEEASLTDAGACTTCPRRTGNNPTEYPDSRADVCTDPECYRAKVKAHGQRRLEQAKDQGQKVLPKSEKLFNVYQHGAAASLRYNAGYVDLNETCHSHLVAGYKKWKQQLGQEVAGDIVLAVDPNGIVHELVKQSRAEEVLRKKAKKNNGKPAPGHDSWRKQEAARRKKAAEDKKVAREIMARVATAAEELFSHGLNHALLTLIAAGMVDEIWHESAKAICERRGLTPQKSDWRGALRQWLQTKATPAAQLALLAEIVATRHWSREHYDPHGDKTKLLSLLDLDAKKIAKEVKDGKMATPS